MTAKQLLYFVTIAETGSFTLAAEKLNLSQPPLSKQIMLLENELDTQLLVRSSRRVKLTESGILLYNRAKDILRMMDSAVHDLSHLSCSSGGIIRLGIVHSTGDLVLNNKLGSFLKEYPHVTLDLHEADTASLLEKLKSGSLDAAIIQTPFNPDGLECHYLPEDQLAIIGKNEYFTHNSDNITISDLIGQPLIYCRSYEHMIVSEFEQAGLPHRCLCKTCDVRTALLFAVSGHGVAIVPKALAEPSAVRDDISLFPLTVPAFSSQLAFVHKKDTQHSKALYALASLF